MDISKYAGLRNVGLRLRFLSICLSAALPSLWARETPGAAQAATEPTTAGKPATPTIQNTWTVQNCDDDGPGSLRDIIRPANAQTGDIVDLSQLPAKCNSANSTITLSTGEIVIDQHDLTIQGPTPDQGTVTVSGGHSSRIFHQAPGGVYDGTLTLTNLSITAGYSLTAMPPFGGGCIYTNSSAYLTRVAITDCYNKSSSIRGGGAISAPHGTVSLMLSRVSDSHTNDDGGAIYSANLTAKYSELADNSSEGSGGAGFSPGSIFIYSSTLADNSARFGGALYDNSSQHMISVVDSTLSGNTSHGRGSAISARSLKIENATFSFNRDTYSSASIYVLGGGTIDLESSIVSNNTCGSASGVCDLYLAGSVSLSGADNLVTSSNIASPPPGFLVSTSDPKLAPLSWIGGPTRTHGLLPGSPAIGLGNNKANRSYEQRGPGFFRATGPMSVVDIGAVQFDDRIFVSNFDQFLL